ncbi:hypothetical protein V8C42DRAFT_141637 [Trichoderma barbatum]
MAPSRSQLINTANAFISAFGRWTVSDVLSIQSPSCRHRTLPGKRDLSKAEYGQLLETVIPVIRNFRLKIVDKTPVVVDVEARRVAMHVTSTGETDIGTYENVYMFLITISEDGQMVDDIVEFVDSLYTAEVVGKLAKETGKVLE